MSGMTGLTFDRSRWLAFPPRPAPPHACCFADDGGEPAGGCRSAPEPAGEDAPPGDDDGQRDWNAEYVREVGQSRKYRQRAQRAETQLQQLRSRALTDEQLAEYERLRLSAETMAEKDARIRSLEETVRDLVGRTALGRALAACGVGSRSPNGDRMLSQAADLLADRVRVDFDEAGRPAARVLDAAGRPMLRGDGEAVGIEEFVADWLAEQGGHFLPASGDTGSGAHRGEPGADAPRIERLDRDPKAKADFIARHGPRAYVQLARKARS